MGLLAPHRPFAPGEVRGPFTTARDFLEAFKQMLSAKTPVVGTTFNCLPKGHIQSMFFVVNSVGTQLLNATLSCDIPDKGAATYGPHGEINISQNVLKAGYNIGVVQQFWRGHDFRDVNATWHRCESYPESKDPYYPMNDVDPQTMGPKDIYPDEVIFFKTTRHVNDGRLDWLTQRFERACTKRADLCGVSWKSFSAFFWISGQG